MIPLGDLISKPYLAQQRALHAHPRGYGGKGAKWCSTVLRIADRYRAGSILDYGCGQGSLSKAIQLATGSPCMEYDPAIPGKHRVPGFADLVVCTDVLEHIEPDRLDAVLRHLHLLARRAVFVVVATRPANKHLDDGRNAHLIIESGEWWRARIESLGLFRIVNTPEIHPLRKPDRAWIAVLETGGSDGHR